MFNKFTKNQAHLKDYISYWTYLMLFDSVCYVGVGEQTRIEKLFTGEFPHLMVLFILG
jgi:hypothetical protein